MKTATIFHLALGLFTLAFSFACLSWPPQLAQAQDNGPLEASDKYSHEELAQMLAPIALYPDALLAQVLMASTYPLEIIESDRWLRKYPELKGEALDAALLDKDWDPSVKAICHFPSILALMSERVSETTNLGNAFLAQEAEVMDTVQELRAKAYAQGNLTTTDKQKVIVERETIIIEAANPRVIFVPYYNPWYIYGPWWYPAYPPFLWAPPGVSITVGISYWPTVYFGFIFGTWSYFDWPERIIYINVHNRPRFVRPAHWLAKPGPWVHDPRHRRGVAFRDKATARKYGQAVPRSRDFRRDTRGFPELRERDRRGDDRPLIDSNRQKQERFEREMKARERAERDRQERQRIDRAKQTRERVERDLKERTRIDRERTQRERVAPAPQIQQRAEQERQARERLERSKVRPEGRTSGPSPDNIFDRIDNGRMERDSSERGRSSRQGRGDRGNKRW